MSKHKKNPNRMTLPQLRRRGWTPEAIQLLLPPSFRVRARWGGVLRVWSGKDVTAAEQTMAFAALRQAEPDPPGAAPEKEPHRETAPSAPQAAPRPEDPGRWPNRNPKAVGAWLEDVWLAAPKEDTPSWTLAGYYHRAMVEHLEKVYRISAPKTGRISGVTGQFLAMAKGSDPRLLPGTLSRFPQILLWLGLVSDDGLPDRIRDGYAPALHQAARDALAEFSAAHPEVSLPDFLSPGFFPAEQLLKRNLSYLYSVYYVPWAIRSSLNFLIALDPKDEYPEARAMERRFILHIGGTNTGKTYAGFQRLRKAETGVYLGPLRLLTLEAQETLQKAGVACSLTTGEEEDLRPEDTHTAATAEKLDMKRYYDVAVIDECQMIADTQRGYAWTRAILGVLAPEIHLCAAPEARDLLVKLIETCGDTYEIVEHQRKTPLICMPRTLDYTEVQPGDALITFSKSGVLRIAEDLRQAGKEPAIIYGALPYATRRKQMEGFLAGRMSYVVSTDAIGMGLNLPIRRVIFMDTRKFNGICRQDLQPNEIQQIAGRAGRYGMYEAGFVGATKNLDLIRQGLETRVPPLQKAILGFSDLVVRVDFDLLEVLTQWNQMPTVEPFVKLDISRYITLITKIREKGFTLSKPEELKAANIPFDETEEALRDLFFTYLQCYVDLAPLEQPVFPADQARTLPRLEQFCRKLDLYYSFAKAFGYPVELDRLRTQRQAVAEEINEILLHQLKNNLRFCAVCGAALPLHNHSRLCSACHRKNRRKMALKQHRQAARQNGKKDPRPT